MLQRLTFRRDYALQAVLSRVDVFELSATNDEVLDLLVNKGELDVSPGQEYRYSNSGYVLLAMIAERASGTSFPALVKESVFDPLGMNSSLVYDASASLAPAREDIGLLMEDGGPTTTTY